jgi:hypothetical protein
MLTENDIDELLLDDDIGTPNNKFKNIDEKYQNRELLFELLLKDSSPLIHRTNSKSKKINNSRNSWKLSDYDNRRRFNTEIITQQL